MSAAAESSMMGCAASLCADRAEPTYEEQQVAARKGAKRGPKRRLQEAAPMPMDTFTGCLRCGMKGQHQDAGACIAALRDRLADLE